MNVIQQSTLLLPRCAAALGMMTIAIFKLDGLLHLGIHSVSMLALCITNILIMDVANVFLFWMAAFWLFLGIRTHVMASFSLVLVGVQIVICLSHLNPALMTSHYDMAQLLFELTFFSILIATLSFCVIKGGGPLAMWSREWRGLIPE